MSNNAVQILWDSSYLWGIMAWNAMRSLGLTCRLVKAEEIAQGSLMRKPGNVLLVPGGSARQKAGKLGDQGLKAIRQWVQSGGTYFGFCGGCGLALTDKAPNASLNICPWERHPYSNRFYHLISGHVYADTVSGKIKIPVWWPGRFEAGQKKDIQILAAFVKPAADLWLADLPLAQIPYAMRQKWHSTGSLDMHLHMPDHQPLIISGKYGQGKYLLSYAHLETPNSAAANLLLCKFLKEIGQLEPVPAKIEAWHASKSAHNWQIRPERQIQLKKMADKLEGLFRLGAKLGIFIPREKWLWGWRPGAPGIICNHLLACASMLANLPENDTSFENWQKSGAELLEMANEFMDRAKNYFWRHRLENALNAAGVKSDDAGQNNREKNSIFGAPMKGGGLAQEI